MARPGAPTSWPAGADSETGLRDGIRPAIDGAVLVLKPSAFSSFVAPMPHSPSSISRRGFTLIEIAVILVIVALMLIIIIPHFFIEMKQANAQRVKDDLVMLNVAIEHYALDNGKVGGAPVTFSDLRKYLDPESGVCRRGGKDIYGEDYGPFIVGSRPPLPPEAASKLAGVATPDFWSPFQ